MSNLVIIDCKQSDKAIHLGIQQKKLSLSALSSTVSLEATSGASKTNDVPVHLINGTPRMFGSSCTRDGLYHLTFKKTLLVS